LSEDGLNEIMMLVGEKIFYPAQVKEAKIDSTPLGASRYDKHADYNPHYGCKMDKSHITMVGKYPIFMTHTNGNASDSPELIKHIEALKIMNVDIEFYSADGGYDSFLNHADIRYHLNAKSVISYSSNAVINKEGEIERIDHWLNKMWKIGGDIHARIEGKFHDSHLRCATDINAKTHIEDYVRLLIKNNHADSSALVNITSLTKNNASLAGTD